jgi:O-antigen ligase
MVLFTGLGFFSEELFNRNELFSYLLGFSCLYLLIYSRNTNSERKFLWVASSIICLLIVLGFLVQSRQSIICGFVILLITIIYRMNLRNFIPIVAIIFIAVIGTMKPLLEIVSDERFAKRIATITELNPQTRADMFRINNALYVINNFDKAPWFGKGPTSFVKDGPYNKVVHNAYLTSLYETGLFGLSILIGCLLFMLRPFRNGLRNRKLLPNFLVLPSFFIMAFLVQALFIEILAKTTFYILLGCSAYLMHKQRSFIDSKN